METPTFKPQTPIPTIPSFNTSDLFLNPLRRSPTSLRTTTNLLRPLTETPYPSTNCYGPANCFYGPYKTSTTYYVLYYTTQYGRY